MYTSQCMMFRLQMLWIYFDFFLHAFFISVVPNHGDIYKFEFIFISSFMIFFISVVPNHCWYQSNKYECGLSLSCVFAGAKVLHTTDLHTWAYQTLKIQFEYIQWIFSGPGSVQWRNDMVLLCASWSYRWPGNYFHLSAKLILCHWPLPHRTHL